MLGSETGVMDEPAENVKRKGRLQPGKLFLVDLERGRDRGRRRGQARGRDARSRTASGSEDGVVHLADLPEPRAARDAPTEPLRDAPARLRLHAGGPARPARADRGQGRGADRLDGQRPALAVLSDQPPPLFSYFKQLFAQVTNPPIDPIREAIVMSVGTGVGSERNLLDETPEHAHQLVDADADPAQPRAARSCATSTRRSSARTRSTSRGRSPRARTGMAARARARLRGGRRGARRRRQHPDPVRPRASAPSGRRSRRCWPSRASTTTSCARARACRPASCSSPASRARSTTSRR